jgi:hypothetical protein
MKKIQTKKILEVEQLIMKLMHIKRKQLVI